MQHIEKADVIQPRSDFSIPQDRLDFRAEHQRVVQPRIEQWLDAETVTDEVQDLVPLVQKGDSEFAARCPGIRKFAIQDYPDRAILIRERLTAIRRSTIDNRVLISRTEPEQPRSYPH